MQTLLALLASSTSQFAPHGYCFLWSPVLLWGMVIADLLIATSYYSIPLALIYFASKRGLGSYNHLLWKFGLFIFLCGTTHLIYLWNIWHSYYYLEMTVKLMTGVVSFYVAYNIWFLIPAALKIPSLQQLESVNHDLANSEARYRELVETANEGVWQVDTQGKTVLANLAITKLLEVSPKKLKELSIFDFISNDQQSLVDKNFQLSLQGIRERCEIDFESDSGATINTVVSTSPTYDHDGNITGVLNVISDITEKNKALKDLEKLNRDLEQHVSDRVLELQHVNVQLVQQIAQKEKALNEQRDAKIRFASVFNSSPNGIIITDKNGIITDLNSAVESMFGYLKNELISQHVNMLTPPEFSSEHNQFIKNADESLTTKKLGFGRKLNAIRRYNLQFPVDVALTKIAHSEKHYYMAVIRDLTEIDAVEQELRSVNDRLLSTVESLEIRSRQTRLLNEYTEMLQSCLEFDEYPAIVKSYCQSLFNADNANVYIVENDNKLKNTAFNSNDSFGIADCWAVKTNKPYPQSSRQHAIPCPHIIDKTRSLCVPLSAKGGLLGLVTMSLGESKDDIDVHYQKLEPLIQAFSVRTSISLANLKLLREKDILSYKDELTGLYNRRFMNETMRAYLPRAKRENVHVTVLMVDIDHFKQFNDNYGHNLGDSVLAQVAHCIEQCMRDTDLVCRLGGEEFLAVMYGANENDGEVKANNIHAAVRTINNLPLPITVSIGVAETEENDDVESLVNHADMALYDAKENGRNQTCRYSLHQQSPPFNEADSPRPSAD